MLLELSTPKTESSSEQLSEDLPKAILQFALKVWIERKYSTMSIKSVRLSVQSPALHTEYSVTQTAQYRAE